MHPQAVDLIVASIQRRIAQGDCPTEPAYSVEILEDVIATLAAPSSSSPSSVPHEHQCNRPGDALGHSTCRCDCGAMCSNTMGEAEWTEFRWEVLRDPARPNWPGVLVTTSDMWEGFISVEAGMPRNFADSNARAERIAKALSAGSLGEGTDTALMEAIELTIKAIDAQRNIPRSHQVVDYAAIVKQAKAHARSQHSSSETEKR